MTFRVAGNDAFSSVEVNHANNRELLFGTGQSGSPAIRPEPEDGFPISMAELIRRIR
ncbi:MAG: hypothetical protein M3Y78_03525 [Pseudomonadota bacterium]|nr:hypothetical protein [Pseudomonadota bacterium]